MPLLLKALPLDRVLRVLTSNAARPAPGGDVVTDIERVTDAVTRRLWFSRTACLQRALIRYALLSKEGYAARFIVGVRPGGREGFEAHAWIMLDGIPIMERDPVDYRETFAWPASMRPTA